MDSAPEAIGARPPARRFTDRAGGSWGGASQARWLIATLLCALLLAPLLATRIPLLVDYPNHLARMHVIATGAATPALRAIFALDWAFIPNMAMDIVVPLLAQVMPLDVAGRVFIALAIVLPPLGAVALHRAWFARDAWWPWLAALLGINGFVLYGFLNYLVGVGLALLGAAWYARRDRHASLAGGLGVAALWGTACLLSHIAAFGLLVLLMGSTALGELADRPPLAPWLRRVALAAAATVVPLALYVLFGPHKSYASGGVLGTALSQIRHEGMLSDFIRRIEWLLTPFAEPTLLLGLATAAFIAAPVAWALLRRRLALAPQAALAAAMLLAAYLALPSTMADNGMVFERLALPLALVAIAGIEPRLPSRFGRAVALTALALLALKGGVQAAIWHQQSRLVTSVEQVIAAIPPGARVLAVRDGLTPWRVDPWEGAERRMLRRTITYTHLPALVTLERDAFWPMIFTVPGKQPVSLRAPYEQEAQSDGYLPLTAQLPFGVDVPPLPGRCGFEPASLPCQLYSWPQRYDYLLRLNALTPASPDPARLEQVAASGWAILYRIKRPDQPVGALAR